MPSYQGKANLLVEIPPERDSRDFGKMTQCDLQRKYCFDVSLQRAVADFLTPLYIKTLPVLF